MLRWMMILVTLGGCWSSYSPPAVDTHGTDVVGPFTSAPQRFVVDHLGLPATHTDWADDLNGDGKVDNQLAITIGALAQESDAPPVADDYLGSGVIAPVLEIVDDGATGAVRWRGAEGEDGDLMGGRFAADSFTSNRDRWTQHPAGATVHLPIFLDAAPMVVTLIGVEVELARNGDGWDGVLHGAIRSGDLPPLVWDGMRQMMAGDPDEHEQMFQVLAADQPGPLTEQTVLDNAIVLNLTYPDVQLFGSSGGWGPSPANQRHDSLSLGFAFHATPCDSGRCGAAPAIVDTCHDGAQDGDESGVDCGGSCHACPGDFACRTNADCQSQICAAGRCAAASCSDGLRDEYETDVDCGGPCAGCAAGQLCFRNVDCRSGSCNSRDPAGKLVCD